MMMTTAKKRSAPTTQSPIVNPRTFAALSEMMQTGGIGLVGVEVPSGGEPEMGFAVTVTVTVTGMYIGGCMALMALCSL